MDDFELLFTGEFVAGAPFVLRRVSLPSDDELLGRFASDHEALIGIGGICEGVTEPDPGIAIPAGGGEQADAAEIAVDEIGELVFGFIEAPHFESVELGGGFVVPAEREPGIVEIGFGGDGGGDGLIVGGEMAIAIPIAGEIGEGLDGGGGGGGGGLRRGFGTHRDEGE